MAAQAAPEIKFVSRTDAPSGTGLAKVFQALSNPHRLKIFIALARCCRPGQACAADERACVGDLAAGLGLAPSTVSHHLKELRQAGVIHMKRAGQNVQCWVEPELLSSLAGFFAHAAAMPADPLQP